MVLKKCKHGSNTGNTSRSYETGKPVASLVSSAHCNRIWLDKRLDKLFDLDNPSVAETMEYSCLNRIAECDDALFPANTLSLRKQNRHEIWAVLTSAIRDLHALQQSQNSATVSVTLMEVDCFRNIESTCSNYPIIEEHPTYYKDDDSHIDVLKASLKIHKSKEKKKKIGLSVSRSRVISELHNATKPKIQKARKADLIFIKEDYIKDNDCIKITAALEPPERKRDFINKQKRRDFNRIIEDSILLQKVVCYHINSRQKVRAVNLNKKHMKKEDDSFMLQPDDFPKLSECVQRKRESLDWTKISFKQNGTKSKQNDASVAMETNRDDRSIVMATETVTTVIQNVPMSLKKTKKKKKRQTLKDITSIVSNYWKHFGQLSEDNYEADKLTTIDLKWIMNEQENEHKRVIFTSEKHAIETVFTKRYMCKKGEELKLKPNRRLIVKPILVKVITDSAKPSFLFSKFGSKYSEGILSPRCFCLDIGDSASLLFQRLHDQAPSVTVKKGHNEDFDYYLLHLKLLCSTSGELKFRESMNESLLLHHEPYPISKIVDLCLEKYNSFQADKYLHRIQGAKSGVSSSRNDVYVDWLHENLPWDIKIIHESEAFSTVSKQIDQTESYHAKLAPITPRSNTTSPQCTVCGTGPFHRDTSQAGILFLHSEGAFKSVTNLSKAKKLCDPLGDFISRILVTLVPCQHLVCISCLKGHIHQIYRSESSVLQCPHKNCQIKLGRVTELLCMSMAMRQCQRKKQLTAAVHNHPLLQLCPNTQCTAAVRVSGKGYLDNTIVVPCQCGYNWCFNCRGESHWPSECKAYRNYTSNEASSIVKIARHKCGNCCLRKKDCFCVFVIQVSDPKTLQLNKLLPMTDVYDDIMWMLLTGEAGHHRLQRTTWSAAEAERKSIELSRNLTNQKTQLCNPLILASNHAKLPPNKIGSIRRKMMKMSSSATHSFIFLMAHHFIYKVNCLLENVCIMKSYLCKQVDKKNLNILNTCVYRLRYAERTLIELMQTRSDKPTAFVTKIQELLLDGEAMLLKLCLQMYSIEGKTHSKLS